MKTMVVVICLCVAVPSVTSVARAQSLGELAKKTQEEREKAKATPPNAYKNDDLKADPTAPTVAANTDATTSAADKKPEAVKPESSRDKAAAPAKELAKDEAYWRGRMLPLVEKLLDHQKKADAVEANLARTRSKLDPNLSSLAVFGPEVVRLSNELNTLNGTIREDLWAIDSLKEEGRRAGALPGWFR